eukprot:scaffold2628_cov113-Isochrysis_galbana.AAC.4
MPCLPLGLRPSAAREGQAAGRAGRRRRSDPPAAVAFAPAAQPAARPTRSAAPAPPRVPCRYAAPPPKTSVATARATSHQPPQLRQARTERRASWATRPSCPRPHAFPPPAAQPPCRPSCVRWSRTAWRPRHWRLAARPRERCSDARAGCAGCARRLRRAGPAPRAAPPRGTPGAPSRCATVPAGRWQSCPGASRGTRRLRQLGARQCGQTHGGAPRSDHNAPSSPPDPREMSLLRPCCGGGRLPGAGASGHESRLRHRHRPARPRREQPLANNLLIRARTPPARRSG